MGRAPCCDKANVKKGPWSPEEDATLKAYIEANGTGGNWIALPQKIGLKRCGKSCRLRWLNYLRPNIKHGGFSEEEDNIICSLYISIGSRWSIIAAQLPGRTDNDIKNYWNTRLKKKLLGKQRKQQQTARQDDDEMKRSESDENYNNMVNPGTQYWQHIPSVTNQLDHNPMMNFRDVSFVHQDQQLYENNSHLINMLSSASSSITSINTTTTCAAAAAAAGANNYYYMFQQAPGLDHGFPSADLSELIMYTNNQQILDGLDISFYGTDNINRVDGTGSSTTTGTTSSVESSSWGDHINSLGAAAYPHHIISGYHEASHSQQSMPQFDESSYFGAQ